MQKNTTPKKQRDGSSFIDKSLREARLRSTDLAVFCHINSRGKCFAGNRRIAEETLTSRNTVKAAKKRLLARKMIKITGRGFPPGRPDRETDIYEATLPCEWLPAQPRTRIKINPRSKANEGQDKTGSRVNVNPITRVNLDPNEGQMSTPKLLHVSETKESYSTEVLPENEQGKDSSSFVSSVPRLKITKLSDEEEQGTYSPENKQGTDLKEQANSFCALSNVEEDYDAYVAAAVARHFGPTEDDIRAHKFVWHGQEVSIGDYTDAQLDHLSSENAFDLIELVKCLRSGEMTFEEFDAELREHNDEWTSGALAERLKAQDEVMAKLMETMKAA
jgi:hypothetical protein